MTTAHIFIAASLDGFIAHTDGSIDWLTPHGADTEDHGFMPFFSQMDGTIMGRGTYEKVCTFSDWPFDKPVIGLSRSLEGSNLPSGQDRKSESETAHPQKRLNVSLKKMGTGIYRRRKTYSIIHAGRFDLGHHLNPDSNYTGFRIAALWGFARGSPAEPC